MSISRHTWVHMQLKHATINIIEKILFFPCLIVVLIFLHTISFYKIVKRWFR